VALDSRIGGALADSIGSNPTVKSFGAETREAARIARVTGDWRRATFITWSRYTDVWLLQNLMLCALQAGLTGLVIQRWVEGAASAGDVAFVITSFLVMSGYLRNIGDNIRMAQRGLADIEDVARRSRDQVQNCFVRLRAGNAFVAFEEILGLFGIALGAAYFRLTQKTLPSFPVSIIHRFASWRPAAPGLNPPPQPHRAEPAADAGLDLLHADVDEHSGMVHQRFRHVERARQQPGGQIEQPHGQIGG